MSIYTSFMREELKIFAQVVNDWFSSNLFSIDSLFLVKFLDLMIIACINFKILRIFSLQCKKQILQLVCSVVREEELLNKKKIKYPSRKCWLQVSKKNLRS